MRIFNYLTTVLIFAFAAPVATSAVANSAADRFKNFQKRASVLDSRGAEQYRDSARLRPENRNSGPLPDYSGLYKGEYLGMAKAAARRHNVPEDLFVRLVEQESNWNPKAESHKGALGLAQLMPSTAKDLGVNPMDPYQNLDGGARYLAQQFRTFRNWRHALAAYNAGPEAVRKHGGIPPYDETRKYVQIVWGG